jgi:hypothetical protein
MLWAKQRDVLYGDKHFFRREEPIDAEQRTPIFADFEASL